MILPWKNVGVDAITRLWTSSVRTGKNFPLFSEQIQVGSPIKLPTLPDPDTIKFILNVKTRLGRGDAGRGELLLALLTGSLPIVNGIGDIVDDLDRRWEVKDMRSGTSCRLGTLHSEKFRSKIECNLNELQKISPHDLSQKNIFHHLKKCADRDVELQKFLDDTVHSVLEDLHNNEKLSGLLIIKGQHIYPIKIQQVKFLSFAAGRVHFTVPSIMSAGNV